MAESRRKTTDSFSRLSRTPKVMPTLDWKPEANDVIIALMGLTGAGKSTFINHAAGKEATTVGHDLKSCTTELLPVVIDSSNLPSDFPKDRRLVLVDTPGLGDSTSVHDTEIFNRISSWLKTMNDSPVSHGHKGTTKLAGIVYLHDISLTRMLESTLKNLDAIQKLCGKDALKRVVLCTTKWLDIDHEEGEKRTEQLKETYWKKKIDGGSTVRKFEDSQKSAWDVISPIIEKNRYGKIDQIQEELVEAGKLISGWTPEANDVIIPLMGPAGAGKSTFINFIAGKEVTTVGHDLKSCTAKLLPIVIRDPLQNGLLKNGRLILVDTPGFGDNHLNDVDILHLIASWLETMYDSPKSDGLKGDTKLAGIVYLHDISLTRMEPTRKNLDIFQKLCGKNALKRVVLCTTKWSDTYEQEGERRDEQLKEIYWKEMIESGSTVCKFEDSRESAWDVIAPIIEQNRDEKMDPLQIQEELVEAKKLIPETEAGRQLRYSLDQLLKFLKQASTSSKDPSRRKELDVQIAAIRSNRMRAMRTPVTQRIFGLLDGFVDKVLDKFMFMNATPPDKLLAPPVGARLTADVRKLIMLLGEEETSYKRLLALSAAEITNFGSDEQATTEVRCWSVKREDLEDLKPLFVVAAPSFDSHQGGNPAIFEKIRTWLWSSCREDMQFGIICLHSSVHSSPSEPHAGRALELVKKSRLQSNAVFATFATDSEEMAGAIEYGFDSDGSVASSLETREEALKMFYIALSNPLSLGRLLEELQTISEEATDGKGK